MPPEELLEAEEIESPETEEVEGEEPEIAEGEQPEGEEEQPELTSLFEADGKKVAKPVRDVLAKLKTENPSIAKLVTSAVFRHAELNREFPGGLTEVRELRDKVEQMGGFADIEEKLQGAEELNKLAVYFENGDAAFVDDMIASNKESFAALAPVVFDRFRDLNTGAWSAYIGKVVYGDLQKNDIPLYLMRLADHVKDKPEALELLNVVNAYLGGFKELSTKAPTARPQAKAQPNTETQRETDLRSREWNLDRQSLQRETKAEAFTKALAGRKPNTEEKAQIEELFTTRAAKLADQFFKDWRKTSEAYIKRNDKAGYLRYMGSIYKRVIPEAITSAVRSTMKGKAATITNPKTGATVTPAAKAAEGFTVVGKEPNTYDVDYGRTNQKMIMEGRYIMKDGRKLQWRG